MQYQSFAFDTRGEADSGKPLTSIPLAESGDAAPALTPLAARFLLPDGQEIACEVADLSSTDARFRCDQPVCSGLAIVAYVEGLGRVEGVTGEALEHGFRVHFALAGSRRERFEKNLRWLALKQQGFASEERRGTRYQPGALHAPPGARVIFPGGEEHGCAVMDISLSGAAIRSDARPELGSCVLLGRSRGRVIRHLPEGFAIEFVSPLEQDELHHGLR